MKKDNKSTLLHRKFFLQINDIIRVDGIVYRVEHIHSDTKYYTLHNMETGVKMPLRLNERDYTLVCPKKLKTDIKRYVRNTHRYNIRSRSNSDTTIPSTFQVQRQIPIITNEKRDTPEQESTQEIHPESTTAPTVALTIQNDYIEKKESTTSEQVHDKPIEKNNSYIPSITQYCSIM